MPRREPKPPKAVLRWVVYSPWGYPMSIPRRTQATAIRCFTRQQRVDENWEFLYDEGYRCLRVRVEPITKKERP